MIKHNKNLIILLTLGILLTSNACSSQNYLELEILDSTYQARLLAELDRQHITYQVNGNTIRYKEKDEQIIMQALSIVNDAYPLLFTTKDEVVRNEVVARLEKARIPYEMHPDMAGGYSFIVENKYSEPANAIFMQFMNRYK